MAARKTIPALLLLAALAACGPRQGDTDEENRQLDNAAHMLDAPVADANAEAEAAPANGEEPSEIGNQSGNTE